jgi:hypothetical protein
MKQAEVEEFHKALAYFDLEVVDLTGTAGYENRKGKAYAIKKRKEKFRVLCVYASYNQLQAWAKRQFLDKNLHPGFKLDCESEPESEAKSKRESESL